MNISNHAKTKKLSFSFFNNFLLKKNLFDDNDQIDKSLYWSKNTRR